MKVTNAQMKGIIQKANYNIIFHLIIGGNTNTHAIYMDQGMRWGIHGQIAEVRFKEYILIPLAKLT